MSHRPRRARAAKKVVTRSPRLSTIGFSFLAAAVLALGWSVWEYDAPGPTQRNSHPTVVGLSRGLGLTSIATSLHRIGLVRSPTFFVAAAEFTGAARELKAGVYQFPVGASVADILNAMRTGAVVRRFVTIPEGVTSKVAADILRRADFLSGEVAAPPEGSFLPETYEVGLGEERTAVMERMMRARDALLATLWRGRRPGLPYLTAEQAVILASVVEKETAKPAERPRIAAVFVNRLKTGMRLESDPTVIYGLTGGDPLGHGLRVSELASTSPYNTYLVAGLPPTPIGNPGRASLAAALRPAPTDDLYFVADGTGGHVFAATFEAHQKNVARWRAIEQARDAR